MIRTEMDSMPTELDVIRRKIIQMEIEEAALKNETDELSQGRLTELRKELAEQRDKFNAMKAQWENEKNAIGKVQQLREQIEELNAQIEQAEQRYDLETAAESEVRQAARAQEAAGQQEEALAQSAKQSNLLRDKVTEEEIARIVERWTGIPVAKLDGGRARKAAASGRAACISASMGQDEAVQHGLARPSCAAAPAFRTRTAPSARSCSSARRASARPSSPRRWPRRCLTMRRTSSASICREYMEKFSVTRLIGAPPGYVGYDEGGQLTEAVRRKPYCVVLFDEVEKAHPDVFNILLQVLDDGRITDSQGRTVDFKNTILILTSNLGSRVSAERHYRQRRDLRGGPFAGRAAAEAFVPPRVPEPSGRDRLL